MPYLIDDVYSGNIWESLKTSSSLNAEHKKNEHKRTHYRKYKLKKHIKYNKSRKLNLNMISNQSAVSSEIVRIPYFVYKKFCRYKDTRINYTNVDFSYEYFDSVNLTFDKQFQKKTKKQI